VLEGPAPWRVALLNCTAHLGEAGGGAVGEIGDGEIGDAGSSSTQTPRPVV
jgi:hypothetical protein